MAMMISYFKITNTSTSQYVCCVMHDIVYHFMTHLLYNVNDFTTQKCDGCCFKWPPQTQLYLNLLVPVPPDLVGR